MQNTDFNQTNVQCNFAILYVESKFLIKPTFATTVYELKETLSQFEPNLNK